MNMLFGKKVKAFSLILLSTCLFSIPGNTTEAFYTKRVELNINTTSEISKIQETIYNASNKNQSTAVKKTTTTKETTKKTTTVKTNNKKTVTKTTTTKKTATKTTTKKKATAKKKETGNKIIISNVLNKSLMKDKNGDNYYLNHSINGKEDGIGVPYIDFRTDFNSRKIIVYAHSSKSGNGPFQALQKYHNNKSFYNSHKYITIKYGGKTYTYQIFSVYVAAAKNKESEELEYFYKTKYSDEDWEKTLKKYKKKSEYNTGVSVNANDKIVILQTCSMDSKYYKKYYRYNLLVMGKLISVK